MMTSWNGNIFRVLHWSFVRRIHRSPVYFPRKGQWRGAFVFSMIGAWTNNRDAGDLGYHCAHYDVIVMGTGARPVTNCWTETLTALWTVKDTQNMALAGKLCCELLQNFPCYYNRHSLYFVIFNVIIPTWVHTQLTEPYLINTIVIETFS